jgi:hypothetical protein
VPDEEKPVRLSRNFLPPDEALAFQFRDIIPRLSSRHTQLSAERFHAGERAALLSLVARQPTPAQFLSGANTRIAMQPLRNDDAVEPLERPKSLPYLHSFSRRLLAAEWTRLDPRRNVTRPVPDCGADLQVLRPLTKKPPAPDGRDGQAGDARDVMFSYQFFKGAWYCHSVSFGWTLLLAKARLHDEKMNKSHRKNQPSVPNKSGLVQP